MRSVHFIDTDGEDKLVRKRIYGKKVDIFCLRPCKVKNEHIGNIDNVDKFGRQKMEASYYFRLYPNLFSGFI